MSGWTKGPWEVTDEDVRGDDIFFRVESAEAGMVALVDATPEDGPGKANAHLIASAPELAEALRQLVSMIDEGSFIQPTWRQVVFARALLARIEGES